MRLTVGCCALGALIGGGTAASWAQQAPAAIQVEGAQLESTGQATVAPQQPPVGMPAPPPPQAEGTPLAPPPPGAPAGAVEGMPVPNGAAPHPAAPPRPSRPLGPPMPEAFTILMTRSIFSRGGNATPPPGDPSLMAAAAGPEAGLALRGVTREDGLRFVAFVEDLASHQTVQLRGGEALARGHVKTIDLDCIEYDSAGQVKRIKIGQNLLGAAAPPPATQPAGPPPGQGPPMPPGAMPPGAMPPGASPMAGPVDAATAAARAHHKRVAG